MAETNNNDQTNVTNNVDAKQVESVRVQYATLDMLGAVERKVDAVSSDIRQVKGWLEGEVTPLGVQQPGVLLKVEQSAREMRAAKNWLRAIFGVISGAVASQWLLYFLSLHPK